jgi:hypothetical protein
MSRQTPNTQVENERIDFRTQIMFPLKIYFFKKKSIYSMIFVILTDGDLLMIYPC